MNVCGVSRARSDCKGLVFRSVADSGHVAAGGSVLASPGVDPLVRSTSTTEPGWRY